MGLGLRVETTVGEPSTLTFMSVSNRLVSSSRDLPFLDDLDFLYCADTQRRAISYGRTQTYKVLSWNKRTPALRINFATPKILVTFFLGVSSCTCEYCTQSELTHPTVPAVFPVVSSFRIAVSFECYGYGGFQRSICCQVHSPFHSQRWSPR